MLGSRQSAVPVPVSSVGASIVPLCAIPPSVAIPKLKLNVTRNELIHAAPGGRASLANTRGKGAAQTFASFGSALPSGSAGGLDDHSGVAGSSTASVRGALATEPLGGLSAIVTRVELSEQGSSTVLRLCSLVQVYNGTALSLDIGMKKPIAKLTTTAREGPKSAHAAMRGGERWPPSTSGGYQTGSLGSLQLHLDAEPFTTAEPHLLDVNATVSVPVTRLEQGLLLRPTLALMGAPLSERSVVGRERTVGGGSCGIGFAGSAAPSCRADESPTAVGGSVADEGAGADESAYMWSERDSVLWLARLLEVKRTRLHQRMWKKVQRYCSLPESEYLMHYFSATVTTVSHKGKKQARSGRLYLTSASLCFVYRQRFNRSPLTIPLTEVTALEMHERGDATVCHAMAMPLVAPPPNHHQPRRTTRPSPLRAPPPLCRLRVLPPSLRTRNTASPAPPWRVSTPCAGAMAGGGPRGAGDGAAPPPRCQPDAAGAWAPPARAGTGARAHLALRRLPDRQIRPAG